MSSKYITKLIGAREVARDTMEFRFAKPEGFEFRAGQYVDIALVNPPESDDEGNIRTFSLCSSPDKKFLAITMRMRDTAFKRSLRTAPEGFEVELTGPLGSFTLAEGSDRPAIFLAGGIGVTPFLSMIADSAARKSARKLYLFHSNRTPQDAAYMSELAAVDQMSVDFKYVPTMTGLDEKDSSWAGERGRINAHMVFKHVADRSNAVFYVAGPQDFVLAMRDMLIRIEVGEDDIRIEEFAGY